MFEWRSYFQGSISLLFPYESGGAWSGSRAGGGAAAPSMSGRVGRGGKKERRRKKRRRCWWTCIKLSRAEPYGTTQSHRTSWRDSVALKHVA